MSALASVLMHLWDDKLLALPFRRWCMAHPISILACRSSSFEGSARGLNCRHQILFSWPSSPSRIVSRLDTSANWLPPWAYLTPANLSSASLGHGGASVVVRKLWCLISSGNTASAPNNSLNNIKLVVLQTVVLWLHMALGMTSAHFPFFSPSRIFLIASKIKALARSTAPFDCGWYTDVKETFVPTWWLKSLIMPLSK
jgi:hypothetical protein